MGFITIFHYLFGNIFSIFFQPVNKQVPDGDVWCMYLRTLPFLGQRIHVFMVYLPTVWLSFNGVYINESKPWKSSRPLNK